MSLSVGGMTYYTVFVEEHLRYFECVLHCHYNILQLNYQLPTKFIVESSTFQSSTKKNGFYSKSEKCLQFDYFYANNFYANLAT